MRSDRRRRGNIPSETQEIYKQEVVGASLYHLEVTLTLPHDRNRDRGLTAPPKRHVAPWLGCGHGIGERDLRRLLHHRRLVLLTCQHDADGSHLKWGNSGMDKHLSSGSMITW